MAAKLGLDEIRAATLNNVGSSRGWTGNRERGLDEIAEAIDVARAANAHFEQCRAMGNLAAVYWAGGRLREAWQLWVDAGEEAERYGQSNFVRWFARHPRRQGVRVRAVGRGDRAGGCVPARGRGGIAALPVRPRSMPSGRCSGSAAATPTGRSRTQSMRSSSSRRAGDPQIVHQTNAFAAHVFWEVGQSDRALPLADEFLVDIQAGHASAATSAPLSRSCSPGRLPRRAEARKLRRSWRPGPGSPGPSRARRTPAATMSPPRSNALRWGQSPRRRIRDSRPRGPAISLSSSRRSSSTGLSAQSGICARASRSSPRPPRSRSAGTRPCARRAPASRGSRR